MKLYTILLWIILLLVTTSNANDNRLCSENMHIYEKIDCYERLNKQLKSTFEKGKVEKLYTNWSKSLKEKCEGIYKNNIESYQGSGVFQLEKALCYNRAYNDKITVENWKGSYLDKRENFMHGEIYDVNTLFVFLEKDKCKIVLENKDELECTIVKNVLEKDMPTDEKLRQEFQTMDSILVTHKDENNVTYKHYFFKDKNGNYSFASWYFTSPTNASVRFPLKKINKKHVDVPKFTDYTIKTTYSNPNKPLIQKGFGRLYRTLLKKALKEKTPEFAGKHIIAQWGCDDGKNECTTGGVIDASTGKAIEFPFKYYAHNGTKEIIYKLDSSLIVFAGDFEFNDGQKKDNRVLFYEFKDGEFLFLKASEYKEKKQ